MSVEVFCHGCRTRGAVNRVTAGLRCACGSTDVDLYQPGMETFFAAMGAAHGPGTGWGASMPDPLEGWGQYPGPMPGPNPRSSPAGPPVCQNCKGSGRSKEGTCRACFGTGHRQPTFEDYPEPLVARHPGQTTVPFMGQRRRAKGDEAWQRSPFDQPAPGRELRSPEQVIRSTTPGYKGDAGEPAGRMPNISPHLKTRDDALAAEHYTDSALRERRTMGYPMHEAECPSCGHAPTHLVNDYKDDAWWHCPNCGPLANIDRNPEINPYDPPKGFKAKPRQFSTTPPKTARFRPEPKRGRVLAMLTTVASANPGLTTQEALGIVRATAQRYPE